MAGFLEHNWEWSVPSENMEVDPDILHWWDDKSKLYQASNWIDRDFMSLSTNLQALLLLQNLLIYNRHENFILLGYYAATRRNFLPLLFA